jgi:hypothetical protein
MADYSALAILVGVLAGPLSGSAPAFADNPNAFAAAPVAAPVDIGAEMRRNKLLQEQDQQKAAVKNAFMQAGSDPEGAQTSLIKAGALDQAAELGKLQSQKRSQAAVASAQTNFRAATRRAPCRT